jgi:hypothetical protein
MPEPRWTELFGIDPDYPPTDDEQWVDAMSALIRLGDHVYTPGARVRYWPGARPTGPDHTGTVTEGPRPWPPDDPATRTWVVVILPDDGPTHRPQVIPITHVQPLDEP